MPLSPKYDNEHVSLTFGDEEQMTALKKALEDNGLKDVTIKYDDTEDVYDIGVRREEHEAATDILRMFLMKESELNDGPTAVWVKSNSARELGMQGYQDSAEKAEENRSSAWVLLIMGIAGIIVVVLGIMGIIPFRLGSSYLTYGVMSAIFLLFIVMGVISLKNAKLFAKKAESESNLQEILLKWCNENFSADAIDGEIDKTEEDTEEILYFKRCEQMKKMLNHQFMNLDQAFLEHFIDEKVYDTVF